MNKNHQDYDLVIIGAGAAGLEAAYTARSLQKSVVIIESGFVGGTCYNSGCLPTKFLLNSTAVIPLLASHKKQETISGQHTIFLEAIQRNKRAFLTTQREQHEKQLEAAGVTLIKGRAAFLSPDMLSVSTPAGEQTVSFAHCLVATGSTPAIFPNLKPDGARVIGAASAINLKEKPDTVILVGGGPIGLELGEFYHRLGAKIILVDRAPRLLSMEDPDISEALYEYLERQGWEIHLDKGITSVTTTGNGTKAELRCEDGDIFTGDYAIVAVGRRPNLGPLNVEAAKISLLPNGYIQTNDFLQATPKIYAAGDINGRLLLGNAAADQGRYVARHLAGLNSTPYAPPFIPSCVYGSIEVMRVGKTLSDLEKSEQNIFVQQTPLSFNSMAASNGEPFGFIKIIYVDNIVKSIYAIGKEVSHLTSFAAMLIQEKTSKENLRNPLCAFPALSEIIPYTILQ